MLLRLTPASKAKLKAAATDCTVWANCHSRVNLLHDFCMCRVTTCTDKARKKNLYREYRRIAVWLPHNQISRTLKGIVRTILVKWRCRVLTDGVLHEKNNDLVTHFLHQEQHHPCHTHTHTHTPGVCDYTPCIHIDNSIGTFRSTCLG